FVMTICWIVGVRAAFAIPIEVRANWTFQLALTSGPAEPVAAARASLYAVGLMPVWLISAAAFLSLWPYARAAQHLVVLALLGAALAAFCLRGFHKVPFSCTYLPGASQIHITMALCVMLGLNSLFWAASYERQSLFDPTRYTQSVAVLVAAVAISWRLLRG